LKWQAQIRETLNPKNHFLCVHICNMTPVYSISCSHHPPIQAPWNLHTYVTWLMYACVHKCSIMQCKGVSRRRRDLSWHISYMTHSSHVTYANAYMMHSHTLNDSDITHMTHSRTWHDSFIIMSTLVTWLIPMVSQHPRDPSMHAPRRIHTWPIHTWKTTRWCVLTCMTWCILIGFRSVYDITL